MLLIQPETTPRPDLIRYPRWESEIQTQVRLTYALEAALDPDRYHVRAHVKGRPLPALNSRRPGACYFDLVIFDRTAAITPRVLIEIKRQANPTGMYHSLDLARAERQCARYAAYGLPVLLCWGPEDIPETVAETVRLLAEIGA